MTGDNTTRIEDGFLRVRFVRFACVVLSSTPQRRIIHCCALCPSVPLKTDCCGFPCPYMCSDLQEDLEAAPNGSVVVLHLCSHNPSGADLTESQWMELADLMQSKRHLAFFDAAYQGYATGDLDADSFSLRHFVSRGISCCVAQSYAKNFGLYAERVGYVLELRVQCRSTWCRH